jgi:hypothetical protein
METKIQGIVHTNETRIKGLFLYKWNLRCRALFYTNGTWDTVHISLSMEPGCSAFLYANGTQDTGLCSTHMEPGHRALFYTFGTQGIRPCIQREPEHRALFYTNEAQDAVPSSIQKDPG